jgi:hypothetical protein
MLMVPAVRSLILIAGYYLDWQFSARFEIAPDVSAVFPARGVVMLDQWLYEAKGAGRNRTVLQGGQATCATAADV